MYVFKQLFVSILRLWLIANETPQIQYIRNVKYCIQPIQTKDFWYRNVCLLRNMLTQMHNF